MAKQNPGGPLRSYELPLRGQVLLACSKCQRKLRRGEDPAGLASLKKLVRKQSENTGPRLRVLKVPCLKMCPKNGVTVCTPSQLARHECSILRSHEDVAALCEQYRED